MGSCSSREVREGHLEEITFTPRPEGVSCSQYKRLQASKDTQRN